MKVEIIELTCQDPAHEETVRKWFSQECDLAFQILAPDDSDPTDEEMAEVSRILVQFYLLCIANSKPLNEIVVDVRSHRRSSNPLRSDLHYEVEHIVRCHLKREEQKS